MKRDELEVTYYAEHLVLGSSSHSYQKQNLKKLKHYCSRNDLNVNIGKTEGIQFRR